MRISDFSCDLIQEGYIYVLTGRFQTDPLERRFSQYRQMSGGRFFVSLTEVIRSESILSYKILLKHTIDYTELQLSTTDTINQKITEFLVNIHTNSLDQLVISDDTKDVSYISGYITYSLLKHSKCQDCIDFLHKDPITNSFESALNRGGLQLPSSVLYSYVESSFCVVQCLQTKILATMLPLKILIYRLLEVMSSQWDTTFACESHHLYHRNRTNSIIANLYLTGLSKEISETNMRKKNA